MLCAFASVNSPDYRVTSKARQGKYPCPVNPDQQLHMKYAGLHTPLFMLSPCVDPSLKYTNCTVSSCSLYAPPFMPSPCVDPSLKYANRTVSFCGLYAPPFMPSLCADPCLKYANCTLSSRSSHAPLFMPT
jgi:hypothetical protein